MLFRSIALKLHSNGTSAQTVAAHYRSQIAQVLCFEGSGRFTQGNSRAFGAKVVVLTLKVVVLALKVVALMPKGVFLTTDEEQVVFLTTDEEKVVSLTTDD